MAYSINVERIAATYPAELIMTALLNRNLIVLTIFKAISSTLCLYNTGLSLMTVSNILQKKNIKIWITNTTKVGNLHFLSPSTRIYVQYLQICHDHILSNSDLG